MIRIHHSGWSIRELGCDLQRLCCIGGSCPILGGNAEDIYMKKFMTKG